jgi:hypothetical protein
VSSEFPELTLTLYFAIQETNTESKGAGVGENFNCVLKSIDIYIVQINTLAFEGF